MIQPPPLPDDIREVIDRAARQVHRRHADIHYRDPSDPPPPNEGLDAFREDITDELAVVLGELVARNEVLEADLAARSKPLPLGYWSFLVCRHPTATTCYLNGKPTVGPDGQPARLSDIANPFPFDSLSALKAELHRIVDRLELVEEPNA